MKKLNEITAIELLEELKAQYDFDWVLDCVTVEFYADKKLENRRVGRVYMIDSAGDWTLNKTVKAFNISVYKSIDNTHSMIDIDVIINIK